MKVSAEEVVSLPALMMRRVSPKRRAWPAVVSGVAAMRWDIRSGFASLI